MSKKYISVLDGVLLINEVRKSLFLNNQSDVAEHNKYFIIDTLTNDELACLSYIYMHCNEKLKDQQNNLEKLKISLNDTQNNALRSMWAKIHPSSDFAQHKSNNMSNIQISIHTLNEEVEKKAFIFRILQHWPGVIITRIYNSITLPSTILYRMIPRNSNNRFLIDFACILELGFIGYLTLLFYKTILLVCFSLVLSDALLSLARRLVRVHLQIKELNRTFRTQDSLAKLDSTGKFIIYFTKGLKLYMNDLKAAKIYASIMLHSPNTQMIDKVDICKGPGFDKLLAEDKLYIQLRTSGMSEKDASKWFSRYNNLGSIAKKLINLEWTTLKKHLELEESSESESNSLLSTCRNYIDKMGKTDNNFYSAIKRYRINISEKTSFEELKIYQKELSDLFDQKRESFSEQIQPPSSPDFQPPSTLTIVPL